MAKVRLMRTLLWFITLLLWCVIFVPNQLHFDSGVKKQTATNREEPDPGKEEVKNGIHLASGLIADTGYEKVMTHCGGCHSLQLVIQNRADKEGWKSIIEWMQETQNLWQLGADEATILEYLAKNYAPKAQGRRKPLEKIEWYELD